MLFWTLGIEYVTVFGIGGKCYNFFAVKYSFDNSEQLEEEIANYKFVSAYYKTPKILQKGDAFVEYETIESVVLNKMLDKNCPVSLRLLYKRMLKLTVERTNPHGGTQLFFVERLGRLSELPRQVSFEPLIINQRYYPPKVEIMQLVGRLEHSLSYLSNSLAIPSNGDFHERNIFSDMTIVDFEGAGLNSVLADSATFIFHTLFAGTHFGPKYGKWATLKTKTMRLLKRPLRIGRSSITTKLASNRKFLVKEYVREYLNKLPARDSEDKTKIAELVAFRLATTLHLKKMARKDLRAVVSLISLFLDKSLSLEQKLDIFTED